MLTHSSHKPFAEWPSSKCALLLICFWLIQWWWSIQSVLRTHTHTFRSTKGLFVLLAGRVCEFGEQGWDYSIISYRGPGKSQNSVPAVWSRMAVVMANHNRGRSPNPKVMDSSQRQIHTTRPHTCGKKKEAIYLMISFWKPVLDACVCSCQEKECGSGRRKERETKVLVNMSTLKF